MISPDESAGSGLGIYVHFPFCRRRCFYCHFVRFNHDEAGEARHVGALSREAALRSRRDKSADTLYFGGGSPSILPPPLLERVCAVLRDSFRFTGDMEFTVEVNPEDVDVELLTRLRSWGVNRLSIGAQSFRDEDLRYLQRSHDAAASRRAIETARQCGFDNINVDLIIGLPGQREADLDVSIDVLASVAPQHVSAYVLEEVPGLEKDGDRDGALYLYMARRLQKIGLRQYEVSNFCRDGRKSRHNLKYWRGEEYIGLGVSASGFTGGADYRNVSDLEDYCRELNEGRLAVEEVNRFDPAVRRVVAGLRLLEGLPENAFAPFPETLEFLLKHRQLTRKRGRIAVPPGKILLLNEILAYFH